MQLSPLLNDLSKAENIQQLASILAELAEQLDVLYSETAPNGNISARQGRICIYKNGSTYETWQNTTGSTVWQRIDYGAYTEPFKTGDWIVSGVTTARTGWTDKSATYSNKFMRINATPLTTGGSDTHTHTFTLATANMPAHTHTASASNVGTGGAGRFGSVQDAETGTLTTNSTGSGTQVTTSSENNVPAYVQVCIFEKN